MREKQHIVRLWLTGTVDRSTYARAYIEWCIYWNGKVIMVTALVVTGDAEGKLQRPQWWPGQSPWRPVRFWVGWSGEQLNRVICEASKELNTPPPVITLGERIINTSWQYMHYIISDKTWWAQKLKRRYVHTSTPHFTYSVYVRGMTSQSTAQCIMGAGNCYACVTIAGFHNALRSRLLSISSGMDFIYDFSLRPTE